MASIPRTPARTPRRLAAGLLTLAVAATLQAAPATAEAATTPRPPAVATLPAAIEALPAYVPANSCTPTARPGSVELGKLLVKTYPGTTFGGSRACGPTPSSEHHDGRAVDWMNSVRTTKGKQQAAAVIAWLLSTDAQGNPYANARRLGVMYVIWDNHIWAAYRPADGWRDYNGCTATDKQASSLDNACHRNHMHLSLSWAGATGRTSYWTGKVAAPDYGRCRPADMTWATGYKTPNPVPCPAVGQPKVPKGASSTLKTLITYSGRGMSVGSTYGAVKAVQKTIGTKQTGTYAAADETRMKTWQAAHHVKVTGKVGYDTWRALEKALAP